jgi:hypothetical protein
MKKNIITVSILAGIALVGCKKDRTCECSSYVVSQTSTDPKFVATISFDTEKTSTTYKKVKKNNIFVELCVSSEQTDVSPHSRFENGQELKFERTTVRKQDCKLK